MDVYDEYATVTDYLNEKERYVGYLASLCAGLEVPFMVILGILSAKLPTRFYKNLPVKIKFLNNSILRKSHQICLKINHYLFHL